VDAGANGRTGTARARLVAATRELIEADGISGLTVGAICDRAGLSRATFYVHFASRDEALLSVFLEEAEAVIDRSRAVAARYDEFGEMCVETMLHGMQLIRSNAALRRLFAAERASWTAQLASSSAAFLAMAHEFWEPLVADAQARGEVRPELELDAVLRWQLRILLTYLEEDPDATQSPEETREELRTFLLPALLARAPVKGRGARGPKAEQLLRLEDQAGQLHASIVDLRRQVGTRG